ncbi:MAG: type I secretion system permease/ATPase [Magnetococcales bacterium]|nr:type I secretion system permease/ATPase [Magnetococcales bacterium]
MRNFFKENSESPARSQKPALEQDGSSLRSQSVASSVDTNFATFFGGSEDPLESCLLFLCRHYDVEVSESAMRSGISGMEPVMSPKQFVQAAHKVGLACAVGEQELESVSEAVLPLVTLMKDGRAVVILERLPNDQLSVYHSSFGKEPIVLSIDEFSSGYGGCVIAVRPEYRPSSEGVISAEERTRQHWFWGPLSENKPIYVQVMLAAAMTNILSVTVSIFSMVVYDRILPNEAIESLVALTIGVMIAISADFLIRMLRASFIDTAGMKADVVMGGRVFDHLLDMQMKSRKGSAGEFANTLREFESLRDFFTSASLVALVDFPFTLLYIFVIYLIGGPLAIIPTIAVPVILVMGLVIQPFLARYAEQAFDEGQAKQGVLVETITGLETIKTSNIGPLMRKRWEDSIHFQATIGAKNRRISQLAINATGYAQQTTQVGIIFLGVFLVSSGDVSMGSLIASVILSGRALAPLGQLAQTMTRINQSNTSYHKLNTLMNEETERHANRRYVSRARLDGSIEFQNVSFSYPGQSVNALTNVSFKIEAGEKVAILGNIGSGKSTALRILLGLYEPHHDGSVLVDNTDIRQIDPSDLRNNIASVLQDVWLFRGSVRQNIAIGAHRPTDEDVLRASQLAGVHDFISKNPLGYDLILSERGEGLSGGQRQTIALARAFITGAPILIMDEPTSMMDHKSELALIKRLRRDMADKTVIIITHRTSFLELVDRVIVFDKGRIVADGPTSIVNKSNARNADKTMDGSGKEESA